MTVHTPDGPKTNKQSTEPRSGFVTAAVIVAVISALLILVSAYMELFVTLLIDGDDLETAPPAALSGTPGPWQACEMNGFCPSRLHIGDSGVVLEDVALRESPRTTAGQLGSLAKGERFVVLDGVWCDEGAVWWWVRSLDSSTEGYAMEADPAGDSCERYYLAPQN